MGFGPQDCRPGALMVTSPAPSMLAPRAQLLTPRMVTSCCQTPLSCLLGVSSPEEGPPEWWAVGVSLQSC